MEKILLKSKTSKTALNDNSFIGVNFTTKKMLLPSTSIDSILNLKEQYDTERDNCNIIRLVCTINPLCTNVLFNNKTEVVKDEGSDNPIVSVYRNYVISANSDLPNLVEYTYTKKVNPKTYNPTKLIQDTQLSRFSNISYHCGLDIFNNHILRNTTFKSVTLPKSSSDFKDVNADEYTNPDKEAQGLVEGNELYFNTIRDYLRNYHGEITYGYADIILTSQNFQQQLLADTKMHLYLHEDIDTFKNTVEHKLIEENGWFGFVNAPNLPPYNELNKVVDINKPINNKESCGFVDMYPNRELFYFTPLYNAYRHRIEKNWNYCLTYPSSSTTNVSFINTIEKLNSLKIAVYDDNVVNSKGVDSILIYSVCKHGLKVNDIINIYETIENKTNILRINGIFVNEIVDDYTFYIDKNGNTLSDLDLDKGSWVSLTDEESLNGYKRVNEFVYTNTEETKFFPICQESVNLSENNMNFSFKKVVNSLECDYYVRIFSRIPNWKFRKEKPTEYEMYKEGSDLIPRFQQLSNDFESHCGQVGFARNIYNDDVSEIVFTDDIDLTNLKDNLGRPLTSIYLTILKNNRGYKDWYNNTNSGNTDIFSETESKRTLPKNDLLKNNETLEYSHCFGKLTNNFKLSYRSLINKDYKNILRTSVIFDEDYDKEQHKLWGINCSSGLDYKEINDLRQDMDVVEEEVIYQYYDSKSLSTNLSGDVHFYGDVVCFSPSEYLETSLQMSDFRFNTAQRDYDINEDSKYCRIGKIIKHDEIVFDDYDFNYNVQSEDKDRNKALNFSAITKSGFSGNVNKENSIVRKEGYYYQGHYEIPIHNFASTVTTQAPKFYIPKSIVLINPTSRVFLIKTMDKTYLELEDVFYLYNTNLTEQTSYVVNDKEKRLLEDDKYVRLTVVKVLDRRRIYATCNEDEYKKMTIKYKIDNNEHLFYKDSFKMFKPDSTIPTYAHLLKDKTFRFIWRDFIHNGDGINGTIEEYPYTNNALYVNKSINFYLKRQDPNNYLKDYSWDKYTLQPNEYPYDSDFNNINFTKENNYYEENDIEC